MRYKVADNVFEVTDLSNSQAWSELAWHYEPFAVDDGGAALFRVSIAVGESVDKDDYALIMDDDEDQQVRLVVYKSQTGGYLFELTQPGSSSPDAWLKIDASLTDGHITLAHDGTDKMLWRSMVSLTSAIQLAFMLATAATGTLMTHSSCVINGGRAFLFQGRSGTGKSTHARLWLENVPGSVLLNDDHPVLRIRTDGQVTVYGSPWSGKTHCYKNVNAPLGAMVRIVRAPHNALHRLSVIEAYASLTPTFFKTPFDADLSDKRHKSIERIIMAAPCYAMQCLPNAEAALCCSKLLQI